MTSFPLPEDETERLRALHAYAVLDTDPELLLDDLTDLAAQICEVPIALISLVDSNRQWFKSRIGLDSAETPREHSFCAHAITGDDAFLVPDASADPRFADNPLVVGGPEIRFYAGAPLRTPGGRRIGTLCAIDRRPRNLTSEQVDALERLARQAVAHFEARVRVRELAAVAEREHAVRRAAEAASHAKTAFLAHMSHELRTPLNAMIGSGDLLSDCDRGCDKDLVATIQTAGRTLVEVIDEVLDFSRIEADAEVLDMRSFSLAECVQSVVDLATITALENGIELSCEWAGEAPPVLLGDSGRLRQVLNNLLANALKFTDHGSVRFLVRTAPDDARDTWHLRFQVVDTGIGMSPEQLDRVFLPFQQADSSMSGNFGGAGLGLTISQRLVELMDGTLTASSTLGVGTIFEANITFDTDVGNPVAVEEAGAGRNARQGPEARGLTETRSPAVPLRRVLVAEDSRVNQMVVARMLERLGCLVDVVGDGNDAVDTARSGAFDTILMDLHMPGMSGFAATRRIRAELPSVLQPQIIAFTANSTVDERQSCIDAGMDAFLAKPVQLAKLASILGLPVLDESRRSDARLSG